jgi:uncharacterized protein with PIN domain
MAKAKTFADKVIKKGMIFGQVCPTCNTEFAYVKKVEPVRKVNGHIGFSETVVAYCKCNMKEVMEK